MPRSVSFDHLALNHADKYLPLEVLHSASGHYICKRDREDPVSRESTEYFRSSGAAQQSLARGG